MASTIEEWKTVHRIKYQSNGKYKTELFIIQVKLDINDTDQQSTVLGTHH